MASCAPHVQDTDPPSVVILARVDQEFYKRPGMADLKDDGSKTLSAAARRSFFRRRLKHKRNGSKDGKELMALDAISTDSLPFAEGEETLRRWSTRFSQFVSWTSSSAFCSASCRRLLQNWRGWLQLYCENLASKIKFCYLASF